MTLLFAVVLVLHGLIHLLGMAKAFGLADLPQLTHPISPALGLLWLLAAVLFLAAGMALFVWPRGWWAIGAGALVASTIVIVSAWSDARFGMVANVIVAVGVVFGLLAYGPGSLRAAYERDVERVVVAYAAPAEIVAERDLARLPPPVQRYLRAAGVVGQPRVRNFRARMHGRIRSGRDARWMPLAAEQYNVAGEPARLFYLNATMAGVPVQGYHRYVGSSASMTVKAAALVPVVRAAGPELTQSETVTLFNDMCMLAPATLIDPAIAWEPIDGRTARAAFTNAGHTIRAELQFNDAGELTNFWSDDRYRTGPDGGSAERLRWSTPLREYRRFGTVRLASGGEARWHEAAEDYSYIELTFDQVDYNVVRGS